ncbi:MAG: hypothetical protein WD425_11900 [Nitrospirales bacterium]
MKSMASKTSIRLSSIIIAAGMMVLPATVMAGQGSGSHSTVGSQAGNQVPKVQKHPGADFESQWSDQLIQERDQAKQSLEQAKQERDQAKQERDQALQASAEQQKSGMKSIQGQSASGQSDMGGGNQESDKAAQERDKYLQQREDLHKETAKLRAERDRAMQAISGGSPLDAVDSGMPVKRRR